MKLCRLGLVMLVAVVMAAVSSCSNRKSSDLIAAVGGDARVIALVRPVDVLKSTGATVEGGNLVLPSALKREMPSDLKNLLRLRGIDYDLFVTAVYDKSPGNVAIFNIKDGEALAQSLKSMGYKKRTAEGHPVFEKDGESTFFFVEGNLFYMLTCWDTDDRDKYIERTLDRAASPVAAWMSDALSSRSGKSMAMAIDLTDQKFEIGIALSVNLEGSAAKAEARWYDGNGKDLSLAEFDELELATIGAEAQFLSDDDMVGFAFGGLADGSLADILKASKSMLPYEARSFLRELPEDVVDDMNGGFFFAGNMKDPSARNLERPDNYTFNLGFVTEQGRGERVFRSLVRQLKDSPFTVRSSDRGYTVKIDKLSLEVFSEGDVIVAGSTVKSGNSTMSKSGLDDCYMWATCNVSSDFAPLRQYKIPYGIKARARVKAEGAEASLEFTGTSEPFLAVLLDIVKRLD